MYIEKSEDVFEILLVYNKYIIYPIEQSYDFFNKFLNYTINNKEEFSLFIISLKYIQDIDTFINIIEDYKEQIYEKYIKSDNTQNIEKYIIRFNTDLRFKNNEKNNILIIIKNINSIIIFSKEKNIFLIYFPSDFWKYTLNYHNMPVPDNILICYRLREAFIKYYDLVIKIFDKKDKNFKIKKDITSYYELDEFSFLLDQIIKKYINHNNLTDIDKLAYITEYDPYYLEEKYSYKVDSDIFDLINLDNINDEEIEYFKKMNFEIIFGDCIIDYISKITSKIKNISNYYLVIQLINFKNIQDKNKSIALDYFTKKYDKILNFEVEKLNDN